MKNINKLKNSLDYFKGKSIRQLYEIFIIKKATHWLVQLFRYGLVGGFSAVIDVGTLYVVTSKLGVNYLISALIAFVLGTVANYILSILWVFESTGELKRELPLFTLIGFGGLAINELIIWILVDKFSLNYLVAKLCALAIVVFWSFTLRRIMFNKLVKDKA